PTFAVVGRRQDYFREEFRSALEILARGDVKADQLKGSWAGAFGPTQFMPTSFKRYAVDFDGDGRRDVVDSVPDVIASTANNLKKGGWVTGQTWGYDGVVLKGFQFHARRSLGRDVGAGMGTIGHPPGRRQGLPARRRPRLSAGAGGRAGAGFPDAAEFPRDHEIQPGRSLCAGHRLSRRPAALRPAPRAGLAAARTRAHARPTPP